MLFAASILVSVTAYVIPLVRSFVMSDLGFSALAITTTASIAGPVVLPLPVVIGWLSDRIGRRPLLFVAYLAAFAALALLALSKALWNFWLVFALLSVTLQGNTTLGSAW